MRDRASVVAIVLAMGLIEHGSKVQPRIVVARNVDRRALEPRDFCVPAWPADLPAERIARAEAKRARKAARLKRLAAGAACQPKGGAA